ncbi:MAG: DNA double-strand break repair nuclease NurA [Candidatus Bathyarchaeia archaeon]
MDEPERGTIPKAIREVYSQMLSPESPSETIHPLLYEKIVHECADKLVAELKGHLELLRSSLEMCRSQVEVESIGDKNASEENIRLVASDAGNKGVDLRMGFLPLCAATAIVTEGWEIKETPLCSIPEEAEVWSNEAWLPQRESLLTFKLQFEVTRRGVEKYKPKLALVDGSLALHPRLKELEAKGSQGFKKDYSEAVEEAVKMLRTCYKAGIPVVGFVKRTRTNIIARKLRLDKVRDTALLNFILMPGCYTKPLREQENPKFMEVISDYKKKAIALGLTSKEVEDITDLYTAYIRTGYYTPFRLEFPRYCLNALPWVASVLYSTAYEDGVPFAIREVDQLTKISYEVSNLRTLAIYSRAMELVKKGELTPEELEVFALQFGELWALRDMGLGRGHSE